MRRREFTVAGLALGGMGLALGPGRALALNQGDAAAGVRSLLERGAVAAVDLLGRPDGFLGNPQVKIPLPGFMAQVAKVIGPFGQQKSIDDFVTVLNRAAESAVPSAKPLLVNAVKTMSVEDALQIVRGDDTSVTRFFSNKTYEPLQAKFLPLVTEAVQGVKQVEQYNRLALQAKQLGVVKDDELNFQHYVTVKALDGLFFMIGEEEKKIRRDPAATGNAVLKRVFGALSKK